MEEEHKEEQTEKSTEESKETTEKPTEETKVEEKKEPETPKEHKVEKHIEHKEKKRLSIKEIYDKQYKKLLIIPFLILLLAIFSIILKVSTTGDFINRDVSLKGGLTLTVPFDKEIDISALEIYLSSQFPANDVSVRALKQAGAYSGIVIDADIEKDSLEKLVSSVETSLKVTLGEEGYSVEVMGSALGASFFKETIRAVLIAFLFMGIVVFISFRVPITSLAVILAAFSDIIVTLAIANLIGMKLSTAGIAAFLMLIGYSVDTNILLSTKVVKRKEGTVLERIIGAMKTGLMMSSTTICAIIVALIFTQSEVIRQIMTILLIGLLVDMINTWIQNVGILRIYLGRKHKNAQD
ncbi:protein translocase subunit SecF [Candidatus Woesearchaeota archaeon]|nr:protein translocase subunit SecF [Candidatus Woesearchaeota archaeon]